ncbi:hypothetical protein [Lyngbya sp. CCY1209]|uniref:hypothetical protein n=1 Tax=Lyngbya sp. CCY1209 TaxID=2886103 RepID=UPI002D1FC650|nr:hypothetical protein [Lyngbya sp. CCY1209]MEB3886153.1 hypothetical protein [Lyngbya sp. CCY1209]
MANYNPDTSGLKQPKWDHTPTVPIRVPAEFAPALLAIARQMDRGEAIEAAPNSNGNGRPQSDPTPDPIFQQVIDALQSAFEVKAGNGGAIKDEIEKALNLMGVEANRPRRGGRRS